MVAHHAVGKGVATRCGHNASEGCIEELRQDRSTFSLPILALSVGKVNTHARISGDGLLKSIRVKFRE